MDPADNTAQSSEGTTTTATTETQNTETRSEPAGTEKETQHRTLRSALRHNLRAETPSKSPEATSLTPKQGGQVAGAQPQQAQQSAAPEAVAPPADMSKAEQEAFKALPADMQKYISRRAYETRAYLTRASEELKKHKGEVEGIAQAVGQYRDEYAKMGVAMPDLVRRAVAWDREIRSKGAPAMIEYLEAYGFTPEDLIAVRGGEGQQQASQPKANYLTREEAESLAEQKVQAALARQEQEKTTFTAKTTIDSWVASKPLFKDPGTAAQLEAAMAPWVQAMAAAMPGRPLQEILEKAYSQCVAENPVFAELDAKLKAKPAAERTKAEAQRALAASRSISGGPSSGSPIRKAESLRENLRLRLTGAM